MAQINQLCPTWLMDVPVHNYGVSDLAEGVAVIMDTTNTGGANTAPGVVLPASSAKPVGFLRDAIPAGKTGRMSVYGIASGIASATIHNGEVLMVDTAGKVLPQTAGLHQIGIAFSEAVNGDRVLVLIERAKNA